MSTTRFLTGITTTGTPHLGNYVGAIRPAVQSSLRGDVQSFYFLANYHALIKCDEPARIQRSTLEIAATWIACGLDPSRVTFYRQSDIPEVHELSWMLSCVTGKGILNRAHAYKAAVDKNNAAGNDPDVDVTAGLFMYPVLMAADILLFKAQKVPVGRDQVQHLEMARDIASSFNHLYGEHLVLPEAVVDEQVSTLPGLDGRKMSKSYNNTIPLFTPRDQMRKLINSITTDSHAPGETKEVEGSALFEIYQAFASEEQVQQMRGHYASGMAWGEIKGLLFDCVDAAISPMRARYEELLANPAELEKILLEGAHKARQDFTPLMQAMRSAVGLRSLSGSAPVAAETKAVKQALPKFKQYRETDGRFYFKLTSAHGKLLLQSTGFDKGQDAAALIKSLTAGEHPADSLPAALSLAEGAENADLQAALQALQDAE